MAHKDTQLSRITHGGTQGCVTVHICDKQVQLSIKHLLRYHENKSERKIEGANDADQTRRIIMRILYYQCVNGVSFLSGY